MTEVTTAPGNAFSLPEDPSETPPPAPSGRLLSLDVLRGLTVLGMILVNSAAGMKYGQEADVFPTLLHAQWDGLTLADIVFPAFLLMVGVSIPMALRRESPGGNLEGEQARKIFWRSARLLLLGFVLTNLWWLSDFAATEWRLFGVLQRIGLVYFACALLFLMCAPRVRLSIILAILILYWPLSLLPALDGLSTDIWARGHNFVASVDRVLLGDHNYVKGREGYDPEGLLSTLPSIAHGLIGVAVGEYLMMRRDRRVRPLATLGAALIAVGVVWGFVFPVIKDIWSSSFVLVTCGITILTLALLVALFDRGAPVSGTRRFLAAIALPFGVNAIAAYVLHILAGSMLGWSLLLKPFEWSRPLLGDEIASLIPILLFIAFIWACVEYLRRRNWIIRI